MLRDGQREGVWRVSDAEKSAGLLLYATTMVALDEGATDLKQLDALIELLIAGLAQA